MKKFLAAFAVVLTLAAAFTIPVIRSAGAAQGDAVKIQAELNIVSSPAIYDQTSATNAPLDSFVLDVSAWRSLLVMVGTSAGTTALVGSVIDDTGAIFYNPLAPAAASAVFASWGIGSGAGTFSGAGVYASVNAPLPRRVRFTLTAAGVGNTVRLRVEGRR